MILGAHKMPPLEESPNKVAVGAREGRGSECALLHYGSSLYFLQQAKYAMLYLVFIVRGAR